MSKFSIDLKLGMSYANPFISKFNSDFDTIEFVIENSDEFANCTFSVVYNVMGNCGMDVEDSKKLIKTTDEQNVTLLWTLDESVSCDSGVVLYQVVAYKSDNNGRTVAVWYSPQGRIIVGESIDTTEYETLQIGSQPSLVANLLTTISDVKKDMEDVVVELKDASGDIIALESEVADMSDSIVNINTDVNNLFDKTTTLENEIRTFSNETTTEMSDIRQNAEQLKNEIEKAESLLDTKVDKAEGKQLSTEDYTTEEKQLLKSINDELKLKEDKVPGKQLSTEDYTTEDKQLLHNLDEIMEQKADKVPGKQLSTEDYSTEDKQLLYVLSNDIKLKPGLIYQDKGEIFNDYLNNKAKAKYSLVFGKGTVSGSDIVYEIKDIAFNGYDAKRLIVNDSDSLANIKIGDVISGEFTYDVDIGGFVEPGGTKQFSATVVGIDYDEVLLDTPISSSDLNAWIVTSSYITGTRYNIQNVEGMYNEEDTDARYLHITGNGENNENRSNAYTLDRNGVAWFKGGVKVGGTGQDDAQFVGGETWELLQSAQITEDVGEIGKIIVNFPAGYSKYNIIISRTTPSVSSNTMIYPYLNNVNTGAVDSSAPFTLWDFQDNDKSSYSEFCFHNIRMGNTNKFLLEGFCNIGNVQGQKSNLYTSGLFEKATATKWTGARIVTKLNVGSKYSVWGCK